jgi:hypothetical protein
MAVANGQSFLIFGPLTEVTADGVWSRVSGSACLPLILGHQAVTKVNALEGDAGFKLYHQNAIYHEALDDHSK